MDDRLMSPAASPLGVKRLNSTPMLLVYGIIALFTGVVAWVAYGKSQQAARPESTPPPRLRSESPAQLARRIIGSHPAGIVAPKPTPAPPTLPHESTVPIASVDEPPRPPGGSPPPAAASHGASADADDFRKERLARLRRALSGNTALTLPPRDQSSSPRERTLAELERVRHERANLPDTTDPVATYQRMLQLAQQNAGDHQGQPQDTPEPTPSRPTSDVGTYNAQGSPDRFQLNSKLEPPRARYVVQPGSVIPATLISAVNSELPGTVLAQVSQDVYDSPTGRHLLIPAGTKLFGEYASRVVFGQSRLMIAWQRLTMPGGSTLDIGEMPGADGLGRSGFTDQVDNHYFRMFASAILLSGVTAGIALSQDTGGGQNTMRVTAGSAMSQALGQQLGQVTAQLLQKNMNVAPTLDIRPGYRFNVIVTKDLVFTAPFGGKP